MDRKSSRHFRLYYTQYNVYLRSIVILYDVDSPWRVLISEIRPAVFEGWTGSLKQAKAFTTKPGSFPHAVREMVGHASEDTLKR